MTLEEFEARREMLACRTCRAVGRIETYRSGNGETHVGLICRSCVTTTPLVGVGLWLSQGNPRKRPTAKAGEIREVWRSNGDHCSHCGKSWTLCERLHITRTRQHIHPLTLGGAEAGIVIPYCARCQEASSAALRETVDLDRELTSLDSLIQRIEARFPELRGEDPDGGRAA